MKQAIILVGMMGSGKTTIGRILAEKVQCPFVDTDSLIQHRLGRSISQIFAVYGETAFREHEHLVLKDLERAPSVISTGGGIVLRDDNWKEIQRLGTSVYLRASAPELARRLAISRRKRPLLDNEDWESRLIALLDGRTALYERADVHFDVSDEDPETAAQRLFDALSSRQIL